MHRPASFVRTLFIPGFLLLCTLTLSASLFAQSAPVGPPLDFRLESTRGGYRTLREARGRVVVLFFEDQDHTSLNMDFKRRLQQLIAQNSLGSVSRVYAVADIFDHRAMQAVVRPFVVRAANQAGIDLLLDWDGVLRRPPFGLRSLSANVVLLDPQGRSVYRHYGRMTDADQTEFFRVFRQLIRPIARPPT